MRDNNTLTSFYDEWHKVSTQRVNNISLAQQSHKGASF